MLIFQHPQNSPRQDQKTALAKDALFFNSVTKNVYIENQKYKRKGVLKQSLLSLIVLWLFSSQKHTSPLASLEATTVSCLKTSCSKKGILDNFWNKGKEKSLNLDLNYPYNLFYNFRWFFVYPLLNLFWIYTQKDFRWLLVFKHML